MMYVVWCTPNGQGSLGEEAGIVAQCVLLQMQLPPP